MHLPGVNDLSHKGMNLTCISIFHFQQNRQQERIPLDNVPVYLLWKDLKPIQYVGDNDFQAVFKLKTTESHGVSLTRFQEDR